MMYLALPSMGALLGGLEFFPLTHGTTIQRTVINQEPMECSLTGDSSKDSKESPNHGELLCMKAPQGTTEQNPLSSEASENPASWQEHLPLCSPSSENFEVLAEKVGTLDLKSRKKNCSGAAKQRDRKARFAEALAGAFAGGQLQQGSPKVGPQPWRSPIQTLLSLVLLGSRLKGRQHP